MIINKPDSNAFDRQERITWWSQDRLFNSRVMVVGAGAIGNEVLKNLALLGFGNIFVVDFDTVSTSNLSRTVLFRRGDEGRKKAEVAAMRALELCLHENACVDWFHGDLVWELGAGVFKEFDIVIACLDNVETRFAVNRQCWLVDTAWIDAGIYELNGHVSVFSPPHLPCYECHAPEEQLVARRKRYSCDIFKKAMFEEGRMPTVQVTSAVVAAIQVQEAIKLLHGNDAMRGHKLVFQGSVNKCDTYRLQHDENCTSYHPNISEYEKISMTRKSTLRNFLEYVSSESCSGSGAVLDLSADWSFVKYIYCRSCGSRIEVYKPAFNIFDTETVCSECTNSDETVENISHVDKDICIEFDLNTTDIRLLNMRLIDIGFPLMHMASVRDINGSYRYYLVNDDRYDMLPTISKKKSREE